MTRAAAAIAAGVCVGVAVEAVLYWLWLDGYLPQFEDRLSRDPGFI